MKRCLMTAALAVTMVLWAGSDALAGGGKVYVGGSGVYVAGGGSGWGVRVNLGSSYCAPRYVRSGYYASPNYFVYSSVPRIYSSWSYPSYYSGSYSYPSYYSSSYYPSYYYPTRYRGHTARTWTFTHHYYTNPPIVHKVRYYSYPRYYGYRGSWGRFGHCW